MALVRRCLTVRQKFFGLGEECRGDGMGHAKPSVAALECSTASCRGEDRRVDREDVVLLEQRGAALKLHGVGDEAALEGGVVVAVANVAFPGVIWRMEEQAVALRVVVAGDLALEDATVSEHRTGAVRAVAPVVLLALADQSEVGVRGVAGVRRSAARGGLNVGDEVRIPVDRTSGRSRIDDGVVVLSLLDDRIGLHRRDDDFRGDEALSDHRAVEVGSLVLSDVLFALAGVVHAADLEPTDQARDRELALRVLVGPGKEALVDLADVGRVVQGLRRALRLAECGKEQADEEGDDRHDDEQLDQSESALLVPPEKVNQQGSQVGE